MSRRPSCRILRRELGQQALVTTSYHEGLLVLYFSLSTDYLTFTGGARAPRHYN